MKNQKHKKPEYTKTMSGAALKQAVFQTKHGATRTSTEVLMERSVGDVWQ